jgi:hypothetical protein
MNFGSGPASVGDRHARSRIVKASFVIAAVVAAIPLTATAQPAQQAQVNVPNKDAWQLLGEQTVKGKRDKDVIIVGKYEGKFDQIQINVLDSDIELKELTIHFANGEKWSPATKHSFKEGQRTRAIDLPGKDRTITKIELIYANTPGGGAARVQVLGRDKSAKPTAPTPPAPNQQGWQLLGEQTVKGKRDRDTIIVGGYEGKFDELQLSVLDSDIELKDVVVHFMNGEKWSPGLKHSFKEGQRSRAIDLPGKDRGIAKIELVYANTPGGGAARVQVLARNKANSGKQPPVAFDPSGWTLLGEQTVNGGKDKDTIKVGKYKGGFDQLTLVVTDSDLELTDFTIQFPKGEKWSPSLRKVFKEGSRSHVIDLPGKDRVIQKIQLAYANLAGGGKAKVQVYGRDAGRPAPPPPQKVSWDNKGWTYLGKATVDGWRDKDRLTVAQGKPFSEVMFVVAGSDVELKNIVITLGNGEKFEMPASVVFKEGTRTAPIDIPGNLRKIKSVDFAYANLPGGGRAQLEVWGRAKKAPGPAQGPAPTQGPAQTDGPPPPVRPPGR